jgi:hypothetical protein
MKIQFTDGMEFDTGGRLRIERRSDGFYVVGGGILSPVRDRAEGEALIALMETPAKGKQP